MSEQQEWMTAKQVASALQVHVRTVRRWIVDGTIPSLKVGRTVRVPASAVKAARS